MPLIRPDAMPIDGDEVTAIRGRITQPFQFEVVRRDDVRCLFVRSDRDQPDPVNDLESALNEVADWAVVDLTDIILLGHHQNFHVPARAAQPLIERRQRIDAAALQALRAGLDAHYGVGVHRVTGDFANTTRLGLRIPRQSVKELDDHDLNRLAAALGPSIDAGELRHVRVAYVVAETDHVRLRGPEVVADLAPRWQALRNVPAPAARTPLFEPATEPAPAPLPARPTARRRPRRTIRVSPVVEFEAHLDAIGAEEKDTARLHQAESEIDRRLVEAGYELARRVEHDGIAYAIAAERSTGYPRRVIVRRLRRVERADADAMLRAVRSLEADLLVCLATDVSDAAQRRLLATKVKVLDPDHASSLRL